MIWLALMSSLNCAPAVAFSSLKLAVTVTPEISKATATEALGQAATIWRAAGVTLEWHLAKESPMLNEPSTVNVRPAQIQAEAVQRKYSIRNA
jgi:hypothetical protein